MSGNGIECKVLSIVLLLALLCLAAAIPIAVGAQEITRYSIDYDPDGGELKGGYFTGYARGDSFDLPVPTRHGYSFNGWKNADGRTLFKVTPADSGNLNLSALWLANPVVEKDCDDVVKTYDGIEHTIGYRITVPSGIQRLDYQWYKDGVAIEGGQKGTLTIGGVNDSGEYSLEVTALAQDGRVSRGVSDVPVQVKIAKAVYDLSGVKFEDARLVNDGKGAMLRITGKLPYGVQAIYDAPITASGVYRVCVRFKGDSDNYQEIAPLYAVMTLCPQKLSVSAGGSDAFVWCESGFDPDMQCKLIPVGASDYGQLPEGVGAVAAYRVVVCGGDGVPVDWSAPYRIGIRALKEAGGVLLWNGTNYAEANATAEDGYWVFDAGQAPCFVLTDRPYELQASPLNLILGMGATASGEGLIFAGLSLSVRKKKKRAVGKTVPMCALAWSALTLTDWTLLVLFGAFIIVFAVGIAVRIAQLIRLAQIGNAKEKPLKTDAERNVRPMNGEKILLLPPQLTLPIRTDEELLFPALPPKELTFSQELYEEESFPEFVTDESGRRVLVRTRYSFSARLIQSGEAVQLRYGQIKNALLSYKKVRSSVGWECERFRKGTQTIALIGVRGKTIRIWLPLDAAAFAQGKYRLEDCSQLRKYESVPALLRVRSDGACRFALQLIDLAARNLQLKAGQNPEVDYRSPYEDSQSLLARGLIRYETAEDYGDGTIRKDIGTLIRDRITCSEAETALDDPYARALVRTEWTEQISSSGCNVAQVYLDSIARVFGRGEEVDLQALKRKNLIGSEIDRLEILARGELDKPLIVKAHEISPTAVKMLVLTGGTAVKLCG